MSIKTKIMNMVTDHPKLVTFGIILIGFDMVNNWNKELKEMYKVSWRIISLFHHSSSPWICKSNFILHTYRQKISYKNMPKGKYLSFKIIIHF